MRGRGLVGAGLITCVAVITAIVFPTRVETVVVAWASAMLVGAALGSSGAMRRFVAAGSGSPFESLLRRRARRRVRPEDLERCERMLSWGRYSARDFDHHLRPLLLALMQHRLRTSSSSIPAPELAVLLEEIPAEKAYPRGVTTADLERIVAAIESL